MVSILFLFFGVVDTLAGVMILLSESILLSEIAKYIGIVLLIKGVWTLITSITS